MKRTLCMESLPIDSFPLFRLRCCWNRLSAPPQTQMTSDSHTLAAIQAYLVEQASVNWGLQVFSTAFISSFHAVEMILAVPLTVIPHPLAPPLFANTALLTSRCVISKDFSLGRLCKWSVKLGVLKLFGWCAKSMPCKNKYIFLKCN